MPSEVIKNIMIAKMRENPTVIDDKDRTIRKLLGLVEFDNPNSHLACYIDRPFCLLKACEINPEDNKLHYNSLVVGGYLYSELPNAEELKSYNESIIKGRDIDRIKCVYLPDGNIINAY